MAKFLPQNFHAQDVQRKFKKIRNNWKKWRPMRFSSILKRPLITAAYWANVPL